jgi:hypothetical protein
MNETLETIAILVETVTNTFAIFIIPIPDYQQRKF